MRLVADFDCLCVFRVGRDHFGLRPVQVPSIFDGNDLVCSARHAAEAEGSVEVTLVATEPIAVLFKASREAARSSLQLKPWPARFTDSFHFYGSDGDRNR